MITTTRVVDGQLIVLRTSEKKVEGKNRTGGAVAAAVLATPVLLVRGKDAVVEAGREFYCVHGQGLRDRRSATYRTRRKKRVLGI